MVRAAIARGIGLLVVWILIAGAITSNLPAGIIVASIATWVSLILLPPGAHRLAFVPLMRLGLRLVFQSVAAGFDAARRALDPRLPLNPGFIRYRCGLRSGSSRTAFCTCMSMVPGTLPVRQAPDDALVIHCLDTAQPVAAGLARDEALLRRIVDGEQANE
jgi:multicomponent Na+:H+ antiporter subunit E